MRDNILPFKICPACFVILHAAKHFCDECGAIQPCAVKRDDAKRKGNTDVL